MVYTCYDMVTDCRSGRPEGWSYFISNYVPVVRRILAHYHPTASSGGLVERLLPVICRPESSPFASLEPAPERSFVAELRQQVLAAADELARIPPAAIEINLETLAAALADLTLAEKQAVWLETMLYSPEDSGTLLRMDARTVEKIRAKAAERIRGKTDAWSSALLANSGRQLAKASACVRTAECPPSKVFLDVLDGRTTWRGREEMERHASACWYCIDHFCRMAEVIGLLRGSVPLSKQEAEKFRDLIGLPPSKQAGWKRFWARAT